MIWYKICWYIIVNYYIYYIYIIIIIIIIIITVNYNIYTMI